jgi:pyrroloquinoline quinone biosynthesis protein B
MVRILFFSALIALNSKSFGQSAFLLVLGVTQDGGYPHIGCELSCCVKAWQDAALRRYVVSLALVDPGSKKWWLFEATPDMREQLNYFRTLTKNEYNYLPDGIFITHAHMGHYTGLMQLGREALNAKEIPVYTLPKMKIFLEMNGPWSQLVALKNIRVQQLEAEQPIRLNESIGITAFTVPHRDEFSETAGFRITTGNKKYLFIPDIDKWDKWNKKIVDEVKAADIALLDATFNTADELPNRDIKEIPHPLVEETTQLFEAFSPAIRKRIHFIHFNHTNPLLWNLETKNKFLENGFNVAEQGAEL